MIYMDNAATTMVSNEVLNAMLPYLKESYGNPSSLYSLGRYARIAIEDSRKTIADILGVESEQIFFTSGASEANNWLMKGITNKYSATKILTSPIEHKSVLNAIPESKRILCKVDVDGLVDMEDLEMQMFKNSLDLKLVSVMTVNNEVGTAQPINLIADMCRKRNIPFHTDATQAMGYSHLDVSKFDYLTFSGHKIHAPKGIGVLYAKDPSTVKPLINGGMQERGYRAGTENVASIVGIAKALQLVQIGMNEKNNELEYRRNYLQMEILKRIKGSHVNCQYNRVPHICNVWIEGVKGADIVTLLDVKNICISAGSACNSGSPQPSHVLKAIGLTDEQALSSIRFSLSLSNDYEDIDEAVRELDKAVQKLRLYK